MGCVKTCHKYYLVSVPPTRPPTQRCTYAQPWVIWEADGTLSGFVADLMSTVSLETGAVFSFTRGGNFLFNADLSYGARPDTQFTRNPHLQLALDEPRGVAVPWHLQLRFLGICKRALPTIAR